MATWKARQDVLDALGITDLQIKTTDNDIPRCDQDGNPINWVPSAETFFSLPARNVVSVNGGNGNTAGATVVGSEWISSNDGNYGWNFSDASNFIINIAYDSVALFASSNSYYFIPSPGGHSTV